MVYWKIFQFQIQGVITVLLKLNMKLYVLLMGVNKHILKFWALNSSVITDLPENKFWIWFYLYCWSKNNIVYDFFSRSKISPIRKEKCKRYHFKNENKKLLICFIKGFRSMVRLFTYVTLLFKMLIFDYEILWFQELMIQTVNSDNFIY